MVNIESTELPLGILDLGLLLVLFSLVKAYVATNGVVIESIRVCFPARQLGCCSLLGTGRAFHLGLSREPVGLGGRWSLFSFSFLFTTGAVEP